MNMLAQINSSVKTMSSKDLLDLINQVRSDMGEPLIRLNSFNIKTDLGYSQPMFTTKGEAWVIQRLVSEGVVA